MSNLFTRAFEFFFAPAASLEVSSQQESQNCEGEFWGDLSSDFHWLFLDIDGVLHRAENGSLEFMPVLCDVLRECPNVRIILSTSWRLGASTKDVLSHFTSEIRPFIVGANPDLDGHVSEHIRWHECMAMVRHLGLSSYTFVDDSARLFPESCPSLFLTKRYEGLNDEMGKRLINRILSSRT
ncbi:HAD domain-containing protein [Cronobacter turicensis]